MANNLSKKSGSYFYDQEGQEWQVVQYIGDGSTSEVFKVKNTRTHQTAALKLVKKEYWMTESAQRSFEEET